jgi:hypothetical protein
MKLQRFFFWFRLLALSNFVLLMGGDLIKEAIGRPLSQLRLLPHPHSSGIKGRHDSSRLLLARRTHHGLDSIV